MDPRKKRFSFLEKSINILVVDDDAVILDFLSEMLSLVRFYNILTANSAEQAASIIRSPRRVHVCIMDLGLNDINNDEYFLLKTFGPYISFLVNTGSVDPTQGFKSSQFGAKHLIQKGSFASVESLELVKTINRYALQNLINPSYNEAVFDTINHATEVLFKKSPLSVTHWAEETRITDRELRHLWKNKIGIMARHALTIYHLFSMVLTCTEKCRSNECPSDTCVISDNPRYGSLEKYYREHQQELDAIIQQNQLPAAILSKTQ